MAKIIEIGVPIEEIERRKARVLKAKRFERTDRVPVIPAIAHRFLVLKVGVSFWDYSATKWTSTQSPRCWAGE